MNKILFNIITAISFALAVLFIYTAVSKLIHPEVFELRLTRMPYISGYASLLAWAVPLMELSVAAILLFPRHRILGLYFSFTLIGLFTTYIVMVLQFSDSIPCSCGGALSVLGWKEHIIFNIALLCVVFLGIFLLKKSGQHHIHQNTT